jgi:hypothetical protein
MKSLLWIAIAICVCGASWPLCGQTTTGATATIQFSDDSTITVTDFSNQIAVQPKELVNVTFQFSADAAGEPLLVEVLDGGTTSVGSSLPVIDENGIVSFAFIAPDATGIKSVGVRRVSSVYRLQFSVANQP